MNKKFSFVPLIVAVLLCLTGIAFGQETTGNIRGTVKDPNGAVVVGATVTATNPQRSYTTTTDSAGQYEFQQLPPNRYKVSATATGFAEGKRDDVPVELGRTLQVNIDLAIAGAAASVNITANDEALVDVTSTKTATNVTQQKIDLLPKTLRFDSVITQAPGARSEPKSAGYQIDGASGSENTFVVDGLEVTRIDSGVLGTTKDIPFDFVKEVQIKSAGYEAEYGGATGGVINAATRSGGNEFHGEVRLDTQLSALNANDRLSRRFNRVQLAAGKRVVEYFGNPDGKDDFRSLAPAFDLGGPLLKNKLWFYSSYAPQFERTIRNLRLVNTGTFTPFVPTATQPTVIRPITYTTKYDYLMTRLDFTPWHKLSFNFTGINSPVKTAGPPVQPYETTVASTINNVRLPFQGGFTPSNQISGQATYTATNNLVISARAGRTYLNDKGGNYDIAVGPLYNISSQCTATIFGSPVVCPTGSTATGNPGPILANSATAFNVLLRKAYNIDATYTKKLLGQQHSFKGGYQMNDLSQRIDTGNQGGTIQFFYGQSAPLAGSPHGTYGYYVTNKLGTKGQTSSRNQGLFFQDSWQVHPRITLNLGIRTEKEFVPSFPLDATGHPGLDVTQLGVDAHAPIKFGWRDKLAPRIGGAWDVKGDGKLKIYGSYSVFYDTMKYNLPLGSFGGDTWIKTTRALDTLDFRSISLDNQPGTAFQVIDLRSPALLLLKNASGAIYHPVDPNIKPVREHEYGFGADYSGFGRDMVFGARFTRKVLDRAIEDIGTMFITNGVAQEQYQIGNPGFGTSVSDFNALVGVPTAKAVRNYTALELRLDKRFSNNYYFNLSYTRSKLYGNYSGLASSDETGRAAPNTNRYFDMPWITYDAHGNLSNGLLPTDRPNTFKGFGSYRFNYGLFGKRMETEIGLSQYIYQGTPLSTNVNVEIFSDNGTATPDDDLDNLVPIFPNGRGDLGRTPVFTQTDGLISQRFRINERVSIRFQFNVLNLFNQDAVTDRSTAYIRTSSSTAGVAQEYNQPADAAFYEGPTFGKAIQGFISNPGDWKAHLASGTTLLNPFYNLPITWQAQRSARFSIGVQF